MKIISEAAITRRSFWVEEIRKLSGKFGEDSERLDAELTVEIEKGGTDVLVDHLRLCGDIPESYGRNSSEEKLYSKYTDSLLCAAFKAIGFESHVLKERGDAADVEAFAKGFSFVADAKAFRLSRTAKNQKDFKVQAMVGWKGKMKYAMVVCPIYQLPTESSQIYKQASAGKVCIFTFSHLAMLVRYAQLDSPEQSEIIVENVLKVAQGLKPSKDATAYWDAINKTMLSHSKHLKTLWADEKAAALDSIDLAREESLAFLASERARITKMSCKDAISELVKAHKIESRSATIHSVTDNDILGIQ